MYRYILLSLLFNVASLVMFIQFLFLYCTYVVRLFAALSSLIAFVNSVEIIIAGLSSHKLRTQAKD